MANSKIVIRNRSIEVAYSRYLETWDTDTFVGNGWNLVVEDDGIHAVCEREYSDGIHEMLVDIDWHGLLIQRLVTPSKDIIVKRKWVMPKGQTFDSCILGLSGGYVDERYVFFRTVSFQDFLDRVNITAVKHDDPNGILEWNPAVAHPGEERFIRFKTDGVLDREWDEDRPRRSVYTITGATWCIEEVYQQNMGREIRKASILHTQVYPCEQLEAAITAAEWIR